MMSCSKALGFMALFIFITVMAGTHEARCDVQTDVKITPKVIKIGDIKTFNAKVGFSKGYDLRIWTITSINCGNVSALSDSIKEGKRYVKASFNTQDLLCLADGEKDLTVTIIAEKDGQTITFTGSDTVRFQNYAEPEVLCQSLGSLNMNDPNSQTALGAKSGSPSTDGAFVFDAGSASAPNTSADAIEADAPTSKARRDKVHFLSAIFISFICPHAGRMPRNREYFSPPRSSFVRHATEGYISG